MSNVEKNRYYWLKLKEDFFEDDAIEWLEEQKNGKEYALFYLKLCLKSLKSNGTLIRRVGTMLVPYDTQKLAEMTKTDFDTVVVAMELLKKIGLVEIQDGGEIYITALADMVGSEAKSTSRSRLCRERKRLTAQAESPKALQCNTDATLMQQNCNREIEKEIDIDKDIERANKRESGDAASLTPSQKKEKAVKHKYGEYNNVLLTDEELEKLKAEYPSDYEQRIDRLSAYIASTGKSYKSHYATIRNWARRDAENGKTAQGKNVGANGIKIDPTKTDMDELFYGGGKK